MLWYLFLAWKIVKSFKLTNQASIQHQIFVEQIESQVRFFEKGRNSGKFHRQTSQLTRKSSVLNALLKIDSSAIDDGLQSYLKLI